MVGGVRGMGALSEKIRDGEVEEKEVWERRRSDG